MADLRLDRIARQSRIPWNNKERILDPEDDNYLVFSRIMVLPFLLPSSIFYSYCLATADTLFLAINFAVADSNARPRRRNYQASRAFASRTSFFSLSSSFSFFFSSNDNHLVNLEAQFVKWCFKPRFGFLISNLSINLLNRLTFSLKKLIIFICTCIHIYKIS